LWEDNYLSYLHWLGEALADSDCVLHVYALMTNHVHLLITPKKAALVPRLIMSLCRRYVQYINRTPNRTGSLWDSRYKSSVIQADSYLLTCMRYFELNPVRVRVVDDPAHYRWTSYRHNGLGKADGRIATHPLHDALGTTAEARQSAYRTLFRSKLNTSTIDGIRLAFNQNQPLGNSRFYAQIERKRGERRGARPRGKPMLSD